jgi:hypothetical protein
MGEIPNAKKAPTPKFGFFRPSDFFGVWDLAFGVSSSPA